MSVLFWILSLFFFFVSFVIFFFLFLFRKKNEYVLEDTEEHPVFAILIPARDESLVIEALLESIQKQSRKVAMGDVYVIVEDAMDPTIAICNTYGATVILRKHLENQRKGYALEEAILELKKRKKVYDAYFIFDADNVLDKHFIREMEKDYKHGYGISMGYRNFKNGQSLVAVSSGLTYTLMNEWINRPGLKYKKNMMLMGTGFYIHGKYILEWDAFPFHSLTEDVELSYYATLHGISTHYNEKAIFYDEQPERFHQSVLQRKRWIRGYFNNFFAYFKRFWRRLKEHPWNRGSIVSMMCGILPMLCFVIGVIFAMISWVFGWISHKSQLSHLLLGFGIFFVSIYFTLFFLTFLLIYSSREQLNISKSMKFFTLFYHPLFLLSYFYVFFVTLFQRNIIWEKIEHHVNSYPIDK